MATYCGDITGPATSVSDVRIGPKQPFTQTGRESGGYSTGTLTYSGIPTMNTYTTDDCTANGFKATNMWSIRAQGRAIRRLPHKNVFFGKSKQKGSFSVLRGLGREGAIPCQVARKNKKGDSFVSFILEGVKAQVRQKGPPHLCRAKQRSSRTKRGSEHKGESW